MSIAQWQKVLALIAKVEAQGKEIQDLQERIVSLEKPRVGRPPKERTEAVAA
jgi:hypothetical protein